MGVAEDIQGVVKDIISSYEVRVQCVETILDDTHYILQGFQDSLLTTKQEQEKVKAELRESLAKNRSLRRKDFDDMMKSILSVQDERENEVKALLKGYLDEQKEVAYILRDNLIKVKDALVRGEVQRVKEFQTMFKDIIAKQDKRKNEVITKLQGFQKKQQELAGRLKGFLARGRELQAREIRLMLNEFKTEQEKRKAYREERRREVKDLLDGFKKKRMGAAKNWQSIRVKFNP